MDVPRFEHWGFSGCVETRLNGGKHSQEWLCQQQQKRTQRFFAGGRRKAGRTEVRSYTGKKLGAEEDGFALEHFDGEEKRDGGVEAGGGEDHPDVIPVVGAGDEFLAEKADVENRDKRKFGGEFHAGKHGGNGGKDDDKGHRREIALSFFVGFGEECDGHKGGGE